MNMFEEAKSIKYMITARKMTQKDMAKSLGVSPSYIANKLRLLAHTDDMQKRISDSGLSERHARALLRISDTVSREAALSRIIDEKMSVERAEAMIAITAEEESAVLVGKGDGCRGVIRFLDNLKSATDSLASLGVEISRDIKYVDDKLRITITIKE